MFLSSKNRSRKDGYHKSQAEPFVFYREDSFILTRVDGCVMVSNLQETIILLIESLNNGPVNFVLADEGDI